MWTREKKQILHGPGLNRIRFEFGWKFVDNSQMKVKGIRANEKNWKMSGRNSSEGKSYLERLYTLERVKKQEGLNADFVSPKEENKNTQDMIWFGLIQIQIDKDCEKIDRQICQKIKVYLMSFFKVVDQEFEFGRCLTIVFDNDTGSINNLTRKRVSIEFV